MKKIFNVFFSVVLVLFLYLNANAQVYYLSNQGSPPASPPDHDAYYQGRVTFGGNQFLGDLTVWSNQGLVMEDNHPKFVVGSPFGKLETLIAACNGCGAQPAGLGDIVFRRLGNNRNIIFNLSTNANDGSKKIIFGDDWNLRTLVVHSNGKVSIGEIDDVNDSEDGYKLYVKDGIKTEKIKVELCNGWCDYVFSPSYKLMTLQEVKEYISINGHLPGFKSEEHLSMEGGIELGEITVKQQEKIEETFLYLIELQKQIDELRNEITTLKEEKEDLKQQVIFLKGMESVKTN